MTQLGDFHVKSPSGGADDERSMGPSIAVAAVVIVVIGVALFWFFGRDAGELDTPPETVTETPTPQLVSPPELVEPEPVESALVGLPLLGESDSLARDLVSALSSHPGLAAWLVSEGLIRRFVVAVDNVADGSNPSQHVQFMRPEQRFRVSGAEPNMRVDPRSYSRYDTHSQIIDSLDTQGLAELYVRLEPLMDEAYIELGYPDRRFRDTLERAIIHLGEAPVPGDSPAIVRGAAYYEYADEQLDSLTPVQKQFIGMGPDNVRTVQTKLHAIAAAIGLRTDR